MKAITLKAFGATDNFIEEEVEKPINQENYILVKIKVTAFNPIDYQMRQGSAESKLLQSSILGRELSCIVAETGNNPHFLVGDEVIAYVGSLGSNGTYTEYISLPPELVAKKPANITFEEAAAIPLVGLTALQCVERLRISKADSIFIAGGAGGVGTMLIKLLLAQGIDHFLTTAGNNESKAHLLRLGVKAENILDYKQTDFIPNILSKNHFQPIDYCIDLVGGKIAEVCSEILRVNGFYADITNQATANAKEQLFDKGATVVNISNYAYTLGKNPDLPYYGQKLTYLTHLIQEGKITPPPVQVIGKLAVETVKQAHTLLENNQANGCKIVMQIA